MDKYRREYNKMLLDKATGANSTVQDKYVTVSVCKKNIEEARNYFARVGALAKLRHHAVLDIGGVLSEEYHTPVPIPHLEIIFLKLKRVGADIVLEVDRPAVRCEED